MPLHTGKVHTESRHVCVCTAVGAFVYTHVPFQNNCNKHLAGILFWLLSKQPLHTLPKKLVCVDTLRMHSGVSVTNFAVCTQQLSGLVAAVKEATAIHMQSSK